MALPQPNYEQSYYQDREGWPDFRTEVAAIVRLARLSRNSSTLEVGCGGGELLSHLRRHAGRAVGVDLSIHGLRMSREKGALAAAALAERLPFRDHAFDAIVGQHLIEHLPDPVGALREWRRVLRPGGTLVLITPNAAYPDNSHFDDPGHVNVFTPDGLRAALETAGFRVEQLFTLFPYLGSGRLARSASIRLPHLSSLLSGLSPTGRSIVASARAARPTSQG